MGAVCTRAVDRQDSAHVPSPVTLNIYDIGTAPEMQALNRVLRPLGTGAFHCGVEIFGLEWSFGDHNNGTGVFNCRPRECEGHSYCESIPLGKTAMNEIELGEIIRLLEGRWLGIHYDVLKRNCCHFCDEFCGKLRVGSIPPWVTNLAGAGAAIVVAGENLEQQRRSLNSLLHSSVSEAFCCGCQQHMGEEVEIIKGPNVRSVASKYKYMDEARPHMHNMHMHEMPMMSVSGTYYMLEQDQKGKL